MQKFKLDYFTATVDRLVYATDTSGNKKSTYTGTTGSVKGYLAPVGTNNQDVGLDRFGQARTFECNAPFDVKESDIIKINGVSYEVKSFARVKGLKIDRVRVVLVLPKNE